MGLQACRCGGLNLTDWVLAPNPVSTPFLLNNIKIFLYYFSSAFQPYSDPKVQLVQLLCVLVVYDDIERMYRSVRFDECLKISILVVPSLTCCSMNGCEAVS